MITKITLEISREENDILIDALKVYERYLVDIDKNRATTDGAKITYRDTINRTRAMQNQIRGGL